MKNTFQKLCQYYLNEQETNPDEMAKLIKETNLKTLKKAENLTNKIKTKVNELGFNPDFSSFCDMIEYYLKNKKDFSASKKVEYLKLLISLSKIYDINLREELARYSTPKEENYNIEETNLFYRFCRYNLEPNNDVNEFNVLKDLSTKSNINYKDLQKKSLIFIEDIKIHIEKLGLDIKENYFDNMLNQYMLVKATLPYETKVEYLKILLYLSEIYDLNLREIYTSKKLAELKEHTLNKISNILDQDGLLKDLIVTRYDNGYFDIKEYTLNEKVGKSKTKEYNHLKMIADLSYRLYSILIDKINNYAYDDLNPTYTKLLGEDEVIRLSSLSREDIYEILEFKSYLDNEAEQNPQLRIMEKHNLSLDLYKFINESQKCFDFYDQVIGLNNHNLFNSPDNYNNITINFNGPVFETEFIVNEYIKKCIEDNLNYELTGELNENKEHIKVLSVYLYASEQDLLTKLHILDNIFKIHHDLRNLFISPLKCSIQIANSPYGIYNRFIGLNDSNPLDYIKYFNSLAEVSYYRVLAKIILPKITEEKVITTIEDFINFKNMETNPNEPRNPLYIKFNNFTFEVIKDLINQYIPLVNDILNSYIELSNSKETMIEEFKKSLLYLHNKCLNKDKNHPSNLSLLDEYLEIIIPCE